MVELGGKKGREKSRLGHAVVAPSQALRREQREPSEKDDERSPLEDTGAHRWPFRGRRDKYSGEPGETNDLWRMLWASGGKESELPKGPREKKRRRSQGQKKGEEKK